MHFYEKLPVLLVCTMILSLFMASGSITRADSEDWPQFQRDTQHSGITSEPAPVESPVIVWSAFTHYRSTHGIDIPPVVANGKVFIIDVDGWAWAFDVNDGSAIWSTQLESDPRFKLVTPVWADGKVFFGTDKGYIYALDDTDGSIIWSGKLTSGSFQDAELSTQLLYDDGKLYVGSWEGKYYCLDAAGNGASVKIEWTYDIGGVRYDWYSGATVIGDYVLFGNTDGVLTCLDKDSGSSIDSCDLSTGFGITAGSVRSALSTNEAMNRLYLTSKNGYAYAVGFNPDTGTFDSSSGWYTAIDTYSTSTPVLYDGCIYVCSGGSFYGQDGGVYCLNESDGSRVWFNDLGVTYGSQASPAVSVHEGNPFIYISTGEPESAVVCINGTGDLVWKITPSPTEYSLQGVSISNGSVFFGNDAGYLFCLKECPAWDVNKDGSTDVLDLIRCGNRFGETGEPGWIDEDTNRDGTINVLDLIIIGNNFN